MVRSRGAYLMAEVCLVLRGPSTVLIFSTVLSRLLVERRIAECVRSGLDIREFPRLLVTHQKLTRRSESDDIYNSIYLLGYRDSSQLYAKTGKVKGPVGDNV